MRKIIKAECYLGLLLARADKYRLLLDAPVGWAGLRVELRDPAPVCPRVGRVRRPLCFCHIASLPHILLGTNAGTEGSKCPTSRVGICWVGAWGFAKTERAPRRRRENAGRRIISAALINEGAGQERTPYGARTRSRVQVTGPRAIAHVALSPSTQRGIVIRDGMNLARYVTLKD